MALPPGFLEELRARTPLPALIGRRMKLSRSGRQWKGCCPFHGEKTPSFYVYDDHYHCFGCGAHGDAVSFVMQSQGSSFLEAVAALAGEAGLEVPKPSPRAEAEARRTMDLHGVLAAAAASYRRRLFEPEGAAALAYLRRRGLTDETIERFGLGWSGEGRGALVAELTAAGVERRLLAEAGLLRLREDGAVLGEHFFNRVMFPIRDARGRIISFGGRLLGDGQPKYVNGPETALFAKRRTLYGLDLAREAARKGAAVVAVEGYMDVIALHQAGFGGAVAPLGTALTGDQLEALWRLSPAPVLCFDGDAAGARASARAADLVLPLLALERTVMLATLPTGEDPDTLIRRQGPGAFQAVLDSARPLADALYGLLREAGGEATPEQRAALRARLEAAAARIPDRNLAAEYRRTLLDRFFASRPRPGRGGASSGGRLPGGRPSGGFPGPATAPAAAPPTVQAAETEAEQARCLTAILLHHPSLLHDVEEAYVGMALPPVLDRVREAILEVMSGVGDHAAMLDSRGLIDHLTETGLAGEIAQVLAAVPCPLPACVSPDALPADAEAGWWHIFGLMHRDRLEEEVVSASRAFAARPDGAAQRRLIALCAARDALRRGEQEAEPT
jgi:DNA primase